MKLETLNHTSDRLPHRLLERWLKGCEKELRQTDRKRVHKKVLLVVFVPGTRMKKINRQFRGKDYATDILSFESLEPGSLGELVLSPQVVRAQAKRTGLSYHQELCYMILHGLLHLLGYDHETSRKEEKLMFELQNRIFDRLAPGFDFR